MLNRFNTYFFKKTKTQNRQDQVTHIQVFTSTFANIWYYIFDYLYYRVLWQRISM